VAPRAIIAFGVTDFGNGPESGFALAASSPPPGLALPQGWPQAYLPVLVAGTKGELRLPVKTKSIYDLQDPEDGVRVLITRHYPRGVKKDRFDQRIIALSPSRELLSSYREGKKDWDQFSESFLSELRANPKSLEAIRSLHALSRTQPVTLLCYERSGVPCHRYLVRDLVGAPDLLSGRPEAEGGKRGRSTRPAEPDGLA
jgi:uncharacterized protein YeaO (DUF488 family)